MPFPYYRRLSAKDRAIYRESAAIVAVPLAHAGALGPHTVALEGALASGKRTQVERAAQTLVTALLAQLGAAPVKVRVLARRPHSRRSELHGLYEREPGKRATVTVWMRTAAKKQVVASRTFLRTLIHEVCHHLDYEVFALADSFHTEGFFKRESSIVRQLAPRRSKGRATKPAAKPAPKVQRAPARSKRPPPAKPARVQLELPL